MGQSGLLCLTHRCFYGFATKKYNDNHLKLVLALQLCDN